MRADRLALTGPTGTADPTGRTPWRSTGVAFFAGVSLLTGVGRVNLSRAGRWLLALGGIGLVGVFATVVLLPAGKQVSFELEDPRWVFYRSWRTGIALIAQQTWILLVVALVVAGVVSRRNPGWFTASTIAGLPWLYFTLLFVGGSNVAQPGLPALVFSALAVLAVLAAIAFRAGSRADRRHRPGGTA